MCKGCSCPDQVNIGHFLVGLEKTGIRRTDPRLSDFMRGLEQMHRQIGTEGTVPENVDVDFDEFQGLVQDKNLMLILQAFCRKLVIPDFPDFCRQLDEIFEDCSPMSNGKVADYIPQLSKFNTNQWAMSVCTVDGQRHSAGDFNVPFTMQSCSKPFTYSICLNELGLDSVHNYVGHEPSGRNFNEICLDKQKRPHNPMLNSGAIICSALLLSLVRREMKPSEKFDFFQSYVRKIAGGEFVGFNNAVYMSERETADRNFAMGYFMRENKCFPKEANFRQCMDMYFQSCSLEVNTESLAVMAATLANGGVCPTTGEKVVDTDCVRHVLSLMFSCGMYNYSGEFAFRVGLPAKSGVSGGLVLVIPNLMGIGLWSPALDEIGNSYRCLRFCDSLVERFNFHHFASLKFAAEGQRQDPRQSKHAEEGVKVLTLLFAAKSGDLAAVKRLYMRGVNMAIQDYDRRTALHLSAAEGHLECVKFLVEVCKVPLNPLDRWGFSPVDDAKRFGQEAVAHYLSGRLGSMIE